MEKYKHTDVKTIIAKLPIEMVGEIEWNGNKYEWLEKEEIEAWKVKYSDMYDEENHMIVLVIDVETGKINNLPENEDADFTSVKVVDCGEYTLIGKDGNVICSYEGYVPECFQINENGFDDYMEFFVVKGTIVKWKWNNSLFNNIIEQAE